MEPLIYLCCSCNTKHESYENATRCCSDVEVLCGKCGKGYTSTGIYAAIGMAENCCKPKKKGNKNRRCTCSDEIDQCIHCQEMRFKV